MKETAAKRRDKAGGRDRDSKSDKSKEPKEAKDAAPEPQDVEMPEEDAANAVKQPKELDSLTLEGKPGLKCSVRTGARSWGRVPVHCRYRVRENRSATDRLLAWS